MNYEINVVKYEKSTYDNKVHGKHFFATAPRSITDRAQLNKLYAHFMKVFPTPEFELMVSRIEETSTYLDMFPSGNCCPRCHMDVGDLEDDGDYFCYVCKDGVLKEEVETNE